jgi:hypothetical protein
MLRMTLRQWRVVRMPVQIAIGQRGDSNQLRTM